MKKNTLFTEQSRRRKISPFFYWALFTSLLIMPYESSFSQETQYILDGTGREEIASTGRATVVAIDPSNSVGRRAVLSSFRFRNPVEGSDTHLEKIAVEPVQLGRELRVEFYDNASFPVFYHFKGDIALIPHSNFVMNGRVSGDCRKVNISNRFGWCSRRLAPPRPDDVLVLRSFSLEFTNGDHHIDEVAVYQEKDANGNDIVWFGLNDRNDDDPFKFAAEYSYMPRALFREVDERIGFDGDVDTFFTAQGIPLLRGFWFNFGSGDNHIKTIGAELTIGGLGKMSYYDKGRDNLFSHKVQYAILPFR